ncbi:methyltransferase [Candidatus Woesearchaeota archaeon]|nr:methyltransferase [Candidatus Woesearchaeota archaeon]
MIYELSGDNIDLAKAEVLALNKAKKYKIYKNILICKGKCDYTRLAYTNLVLEEIFIDTKIPNINWDKYYKDNFCIRSNITAKEREIAPIIWNALKHPKVQLNHSSTELWFYFIDKDIICGKKVYQREEKFQKRRPDIRPGFFPISLKPKLARALVNLSGVNKGTIWDPFCGTGGILLEASLMGLKIIGTDIDPLMIRAAKQNFEHYKIKAKVYKADAREEIIKCKAIVTDPPYGRRASTNKVIIKKLYEEFLAHVYPFVDIVVLMSPNDLKIKTKYKLVHITDDFVHGSLTRRIYVLKKKENPMPNPQQELIQPRKHVNHNQC